MTAYDNMDSDLDESVKKTVEGLVESYKNGLQDTDMEGFDITYEQACTVLDDFILAVKNGLTC